MLAGGIRERIAADLCQRHIGFSGADGRSENSHRRDRDGP
jgi:hypothetical protein